MKKHVLVISSSPRKGGNSDILCDHFIRGAAEAGNEVEKISLAGKKIGFCTGCYACEKGECPQKDDVRDILEKMRAADVIVLATPVYFYTMCAQLKALIDRSVMFYPNIRNKTFFYLMCMADTEKGNFRGTVEALHGFFLCCENSVEAGMVQAAGMFEKGAVAGSPYCEEAYRLGKSVC